MTSETSRCRWTVSLFVTLVLISIAASQRCMICGPQEEGGTCQPSKEMEVPTNITINDRMCTAIEGTDYHLEVLCEEFKAPKGYYFECADKTNSQFSCRSTCGPSIASIGTGPEFDLLNQNGGLLLGKEANKGSLFDFSNFNNGGALDFGLSGIGKTPFVQNGAKSSDGRATSQSKNSPFQSNNVVTGSGASSSASSQSDGDQFSSNIFGRNIFDTPKQNNNVFSVNGKTNDNANDINSNNYYNTINNNNNNNFNNNKNNNAFNNNKLNGLGLSNVDNNNNKNDNNNNNKNGGNIFQFKNPFQNSQGLNQGNSGFFKSPFNGPPTAPDSFRQPIGSGILAANNARRPTTFNSDLFTTKSPNHGKRDTDGIYADADGSGKPGIGSQIPKGDTDSNLGPTGFNPNLKFEVSPSNLVVASADDNSDVNLNKEGTAVNNDPVKGIAVGEPYPGAGLPFPDGPKAYPTGQGNDKNQGPVNGIAVGEPYPGAGLHFPDGPKAYPTGQGNDKNQGPVNGIAVGEPYPGAGLPFPDDPKSNPQSGNDVQGPVNGIAIGEPYPGVGLPFPDDPKAYPPNQRNNNDQGPTNAIAVGEPYPGAGLPYPDDPKSYPSGSGQGKNDGQGPFKGIAVGEPYPGVGPSLPSNSKNTPPPNPNAYPGKNSYPSENTGSDSSYRYPTKVQSPQNQNTGSGYDQNIGGGFRVGPKDSDRRGGFPTNQRGTDNSIDLGKNRDKMADRSSGLGGLEQKGVKPPTGLDGSRLNGDQQTADKSVDFDGTSLLADSDFLDKTDKDRSRTKVPKEFEQPFQAENNIFPGFKDFANGNDDDSAFGTGKSVFNLFKDKDSSPPGFRNGEFNFNNRDFLKPDDFGQNGAPQGNDNGNDGTPSSQTKQSNPSPTPNRSFPLHKDTKSFFPSPPSATPAINKGNPSAGPGPRGFVSNPSFNNRPGPSSSNISPPESRGNSYNPGSYPGQNAVPAQSPYGQTPRNGPVYPPDNRYGPGPSRAPSSNPYGGGNPAYQNPSPQGNYQPYPGSRNPLNYIPPNRQQFQLPGRNPNGPNEGAPQSGVGGTPYDYRPSGTDTTPRNPAYPVYGNRQPPQGYGPQPPPNRNGPTIQGSRNPYQYPSPSNNNNNNYNPYQQQGSRGQPVINNGYNNYPGRIQGNPSVYPQRPNNNEYSPRGPSPNLSGYGPNESRYPPNAPPPQRSQNLPAPRESFPSGPQGSQNSDYGYPGPYQRSAAQAPDPYPSNAFNTRRPGGPAPPQQNNRPYQYGPISAAAYRPRDNGPSSGGSLSYPGSGNGFVVNLKPLNSAPYRGSAPAAYGSQSEPGPTVVDREYNSYDQPSRGAPPPSYESEGRNPPRLGGQRPPTNGPGPGFGGPNNQPQPSPSSSADDPGSYSSPPKQTGRPRPDDSPFTHEALLDASPFSFEDPLTVREEPRPDSRDPMVGYDQGYQPKGASPDFNPPANQNAQQATPREQYTPQSDPNTFGRRNPGDFGFGGSFGSFGGGQFKEGFDSGGFSDPDGYFGDSAFTDATTTENTQESSKQTQKEAQDLTGE